MARMGLWPPALEVLTCARQQVRPGWLNVLPPTGITTLFLQAAKPTARGGGVCWAVQGAAVHGMVRFSRTWPEAVILQSLSETGSAQACLDSAI